MRFTAPAGVPALPNRFPRALATARATLVRSEIRQLVGVRVVHSGRLTEMMQMSMPRYGAMVMAAP